jgi:subtilisin family serine protease
LRRALLSAAAVAALALACAPAALGAPGSPTVLAQLPAGADARDVARDAGLVLSRAFPEIGWAEFEVPGGGGDTADARGRLLDDPRVFRLDWQRSGESLETHVVPSDTFTSSPASFEDGETTDWQWRRGDFYPAWDVGRGSARTRVAVLDSEIDTNHPELAPKVVAAYNAEAQFPSTYRSANVRASDSQIAGAQADPDDNDLHGTHVAGLAAAATNNGAGVSGAGFDTALMASKVTLSVPAGAGGTSRFVANVVDAITWATDSGARVINMSFGTGTFHPALAAAVGYAVSHDVLPVAAAGNTQEDPSLRGLPLYPAALPGVLAVGATDSSGAITSFSTQGAYVDVAAPGDRILSTWDTRAPGVEAGPGRIAGYQVLRGTSMASPIVAGLAGLMRDLRPDLGEGQIESIIEATAIDRGAPGRDPAYGAGDIDAAAAMRATASAVPGGPAASQPAAGPAPARLIARSRITYACAVGERRARIGRRLAIVRGARLVCRGRVVPAQAGVRILVQRLRHGTWTAIGAAKTTAHGRVRFSVRLRTRGFWAVRGIVPRTATHGFATGGATRLAVAPRRR